MNIDIIRTQLKCLEDSKEKSKQSMLSYNAQISDLQNKIKSQEDTIEALTEIVKRVEQLLIDLGKA